MHKIFNNFFVRNSSSGDDSDNDNDSDYNSDNDNDNDSDDDSNSSSIVSCASRCQLLGFEQPQGQLVGVSE